MRDLLDRIAGHPAIDVSPRVARRIHARARGVFLRQAGLAGRPRLARFDRLWNAYLEPAAVTIIGAAQLAWVFETVRRLVA